MPPVYDGWVLTEKLKKQLFALLSGFGGSLFSATDFLWPLFFGLALPLFNLNAELFEFAGNSLMGSILFQLDCFSYRLQMCYIAFSAPHLAVDKHVIVIQNIHNDAFFSCISSCNLHAYPSYFHHFVSLCDFSALGFFCFQSILCPCLLNHLFAHASGAQISTVGP